MQRVTTLFSLTALAIATVVPSGSAEACGGFFCSQTPIDQSGEAILFSVDEGSGTVSTHVQISFEGEAEDFAWIVPVSGIPDLFLSTDELFMQLDARLSTQFWLDWNTEGECDRDDIFFLDASSDDVASNAESGGVTVLATEVVGPYDTVVLAADSSEELLTWLQDHNFDIPDSLDPVLSPYVNGGSNFVALRLSNDRDVGELAPLGMTTTAEKAMIPIQLTSIAATNDMRLEVYIVGNERSVPENYLHVQINQAAIDWWNFGTNYEDVITLAADEAGGQAFATDYSGSTQQLHDVLYWNGRYNMSAFDGITDPVLFMNEIMGQFAASQSLMNLLRVYIPMPQNLVDQGVDETDFYNNLGSYEQHLDPNFDGPAFAGALEEILVEPLKGANNMLKNNSTITRLTSSISPLEMTVDPVFVFNPDMGDVSNVYNAKLITSCDDDQDYDEAPRRLELPDGRTILLPPLEWMEDHDMTDFEFVQELTVVNAAIIERTGASGQPEVLTDHTDSLNAQTNAFNERVRQLLGANGCGGCSTTSPAPAMGWLGLIALAFLRRRSA